MNKLIMETLSSLNLPVFFVEQGEDNSYPQIVFNVRSGPWLYEDDKITGKQYEVSLSLLSKNDYLDLKEQIEILMLQAGFKLAAREYYPEYIKELECYVVPSKFYYYKDLTKKENDKICQE